MKENEDEVLQMGYDSINDIGLHSTCKGAALYLALLLGGPLPAAICLRGGWSMGQIKDIYFHQMQSGDQFTGRCASLLNMFWKDFAASPVVFDSTIEESWVNATIAEVFPAFAGIKGMQRILWMCLASLVYHTDQVLHFGPNYIARNAIPIFRDPSKMQAAIGKIKIGKIKIVYAWEDNCGTITGEPPHIKQLVNLEAIRDDTASLAESVEKAVMVGNTKYVDVRRIGSGDITEARVKEMISSAVATAISPNTEDLMKRFDNKLDSLRSAFGEASGNIGGQKGRQPTAGHHFNCEHVEEY
jgi:hypothetical protein